MIDPALTLLMRMLMKAGFRKAWWALKKPSVAIMAFLMCGMISSGFIPAIVLAFTSDAQTTTFVSPYLAGSIPVVMYMMAAFMVATAAGAALLELRPPELQFVLAGPFTNSQILSYRLMTLTIGLIPLSVIFTLLTLPHAGSLIGSVFGVALGGAFITLIAFQYTLLQPRLPSGVLTTIRLAALLSVMLIVLETARNVLISGDAYSAEMISGALSDGWAASLLSLPFRPFANTFSNPMGFTMLINVGMSLGIVALATISCYRTNAGFCELAVEGVARRTQKLERIRSGNVYGHSIRKAERRQLIPELGWLGGVGPVAWSQLTSALRRTGRLVPGVIMLGIVAAIAAAVLIRIYPEALASDQRTYAIPLALGVSSYVGFLVSMSAQTGFSARPRLLTWYQVLPINPFALSVGMNAGTAALFVAIQFAFCLPALAVSNLALIPSVSILFAGLAMSVSFATTINFVCATTELRPMPQGTPDVFQGAKVMIFMLVLGLAMLPILLLAAASASIAGFAFGFSWATCSIAAGLAVFSVQPILWWISGQRFLRRGSC